MMPQISMTVTYFRLLNHSNQLLNTHSDSSSATKPRTTSECLPIMAECANMNLNSVEKLFLSSVARLACCRFGSPCPVSPSRSPAFTLTRFIRRNGIIFMCFYGLRSLSCFFHIFIQRSHVPILVCRCCRGCTSVTVAASQIGQPTLAAAANVPSTQSLPQKAARLKKIHKFFSPIFVQFVLGEKKRLQLNLNCMFCRFFCRPQTWQRLWLRCCC